MQKTFTTLVVVSALECIGMCSAPEPTAASEGGQEETSGAEAEIGTEAFDERYPWSDQFDDVPPTATLVDRFAAPEGFERIRLEQNSFERFLRELPIRLDRRTVETYDGERIAAPSAGIVALPVGGANLQQCADSIIRLRAEYLWGAGRSDAVDFHFTSGDRSGWRAWRRGERFRVDGATVERVDGPERRATHGEFVDYLRHLFRYAGTRSLRFDSEPVADGEDIRPGDFFVDPGSPGHAVLVLDVAVDGDGRRAALLGQGFMPAQDFHVVEGTGGRVLDGVWFLLPDDEDETLDTPSWEPFGRDQVRRF